MGRKQYANKVDKRIESKALSPKKELPAVTRRSGRIRNQIPLSQNRKLDVVYEPNGVAYEPTNMEITIRNQIPLSQNRKLDVVYEPNGVAYEPTNTEIPVHSERSLEEKVDYIFQAVEELKSKVETLMKENYELSKKAEVATEKIEGVEALMKENYELFKKAEVAAGKIEGVEALMKENHELSKKAEVAAGKIEGYAEATRVWSEVLGQMKDVFVTSKSPKATQKSQQVCASNKCLWPFGSFRSA